MKYITNATENRIKEMVRNDHRYGWAMKDLLDGMKSRYGCLSATVSECKKWGIDLENRFQISIPEYYNANLYRGLSIAIPELFHATYCLDLHHADVYDFNKLVKTLYEMPCNGYGTI